MVAHNPKMAKKLGIPQSVGRDFIEADKGKKFKEGGMATKMFGGKESKAEETKEAKAVKTGKISPSQYAKGEKSEGHNGKALAKGKALKSGKLSVGEYTKGMKAGGVPTANDMGNMGMRKGGCVKKYAAGGAIKPAPTKDNGTPTAKEQAEMRKVRDEQRTSKLENDAYNKSSGMKFAKGGPISSDKNMKDLNKTIEANKLKDYMSSEAKLREQRDTASTKKFARGGGIEKKGKTKGRFI